VTTVRDPAHDAALGGWATRRARPGRTPRVALAGCRPSPAFPEGSAGVGDDGILVDALATKGTEATWVAWDDPAADWDAFDLVALRSTWDYPTGLDRFRAWVQQVAVTTGLVNPARLVLGNLHKSYLADLGPDAVPALVVPRGMTVDLGQLPWREVVVKPAVALGGAGAVRRATQADLDALTLADEGRVDAVVQPYLPSVERVGEVSVVWVDGEATHAVRKRQGGAVEPEPLTDTLVAVARRVIDRLPAHPAYARVDLLDAGDRLLVGELELVEPQLWLDHSPRAAERFADCLATHARTRAVTR
jgi:hypothetical protein